MTKSRCLEFTNIQGFSTVKVYIVSDSVSQNAVMILTYSTYYEIRYLVSSSSIFTFSLVTTINRNSQVTKADIIDSVMSNFNVSVLTWGSTSYTLYALNLSTGTLTILKQGSMTYDSSQIDFVLTTASSTLLFNSTTSILEMQFDSSSSL
jgi:hypothetical protein